jgi:putative transposase
VGLHVLAKLRYTAALYWPYDGPYSGRGPRRQYGQQRDDQHMPSAYVPSTARDQESRPQSAHMSLWHKQCAEVLNIVGSGQTHLPTKKTAPVVRCRSDVSLG